MGPLKCNLSETKNSNNFTVARASPLTSRKTSQVRNMAGLHITRRRSCLFFEFMLFYLMFTFEITLQQTRSGNKFIL